MQGARSNTGSRPVNLSGKRSTSLHAPPQQAPKATAGNEQLIDAGEQTTGGKPVAGPGCGVAPQTVDHRSPPPHPRKLPQPPFRCRWRCRPAGRPRPGRRCRGSGRRSVVRTISPPRLDRWPGQGLAVLQRQPLAARSSGASLRTPALSSRAWRGGRMCWALDRASCFRWQQPIDPTRFYVKRRLCYWVHRIPLRYSTQGNDNSSVVTVNWQRSKPFLATL